jgi:hypothetical protein
MASIVRRNSAKSGLVLLESSVSVAEDGFINVMAFWLAPQAGLGANDFALDSPWPISAAPLPAGMPPNQGGPYLSRRNIFKKNGLLYVETSYVTAAFPIRIVETSSSAKASFSGYQEDENGGTSSLSFDYHSVSRTFAYTTVGIVRLESPAAAPQGMYNIRREGVANGVRALPAKTVTATRERIGVVNRFTITATGIYEQVTGGTQFFIHDASGGVFDYTNQIYSFTTG